MNWLIPGKTFLAGEYLALNQGPALLMTTTSCFEYSYSDIESNEGFFLHPESPAARYLKRHNFHKKINWYDPYQNSGGLGASSAQFIGSYLACHREVKPQLSQMFRAYMDTEKGRSKVPASGYDVLAQGLNQVVYINKADNVVEVLPWLFESLDFLLIHTGNKVNTHEHLLNFNLPKLEKLFKLYDVVECMRDAFKKGSVRLFLTMVNEFSDNLIALSLVAEKTVKILQELKTIPQVLAAKGCGALGADIVLVLFKRQDRDIVLNKLKTFKKNVLNASLYQQAALFENNFSQALAILAE